MKRKRINLVLCLLFSSILCFAQDYAELYIYRDNSSLFAGNNHEVSVNGTYLTAVPNENYIVVKIPAGKNTLSSYSSYMSYDNNGNGTPRRTYISLILQNVELGNKYFVQIKDFMTPAFTYIKKEKEIKKIEKKIAKEDLGLIGEFNLVMPTGNNAESDEGNNSGTNEETSNDNISNDNPMLRMMNNR